MAASLFNKKTICVITGPTKGLGRCIAVRFCKELPKGSLFVLLARTEKLLSEVASNIDAVDGMQAVTAVFDQGSVSQDRLNSLLPDCLKKANADLSTFGRAFLVHNAASIGSLKYAKDLDKVDELANCFNTNLTGCVALNAKFMQVFKNLEMFICNISSPSAINPYKSWLLYCMAKTAREMMMKVISSEDAKVRTLNYAPGALITDMYAQALNNTMDPELREKLDGLQHNTVTLEECVGGLVKVMQRNTFENAAHIKMSDAIRSLFQSNQG